MSLVVQPHQDLFVSSVTPRGGGLSFGGTKHAGHSDWKIIETPKVVKMGGGANIYDERKYDGPSKKIVRLKAPPSMVKPTIVRERFTSFHFIPTPYVNLTARGDYPAPPAPPAPPSFTPQIKKEDVVPMDIEPESSQALQPTPPVVKQENTYGQWMQEQLQGARGFSPPAPLPPLQSAVPPAPPLPPPPQLGPSSGEITSPVLQKASASLKRANAIKQKETNIPHGFRPPPVDMDFEVKIKQETPVDMNIDAPQQPGSSMGGITAEGLQKAYDSLKRRAEDSKQKSKKKKIDTSMEEVKQERQQVINPPGVEQQAPPPGFLSGLMNQLTGYQFRSGKALQQAGTDTGPASGSVPTDTQDLRRSTRLEGKAPVSYEGQDVNTSGSEFEPESSTSSSTGSENKPSSSNKRAKINPITGRETLPVSNTTPDIATVQEQFGINPITGRETLPVAEETTPVGTARPRKKVDYSNQDVNTSGSDYEETIKGKKEQSVSSPSSTPPVTPLKAPELTKILQEVKKSSVERVEITPDVLKAATGRLKKVRETLDQSRPSKARASLLDTVSKAAQGLRGNETKQAESVGIAMLLKDALKKRNLAMESEQDDSENIDEWGLEQQMMNNEMNQQQQLAPIEFTTPDIIVEKKTRPKKKTVSIEPQVTITDIGPETTSRRTGKERVVYKDMDANSSGSDYAPAVKTKQLRKKKAVTTEKPAPPKPSRASRSSKTTSYSGLDVESSGSDYKPSSSKPKRKSKK
jgi:hypothetical protein